FVAGPVCPFAGAVVLGGGGGRAYDHSGGAIAALAPVTLAEAFLHRVQVSVGSDAFDSGDVGSVGLHREHRAGLHGLSVDMDCAGSAVAGLAADVGSRES